MRKLSTVLFLILVVSLSCSAKYRNMQSFETVWQTVNEKHYDPTFGGVDWKKIHDRYKPKIAAAEDESEFYLYTNQMLFELNLSHLLVATQEDLERYIPILTSRGAVGIDIKWMGEDAVVTNVRPDTQAVERAFIIGDRSPGYLLGADWIKLLNGGYFMHAILQPLPAGGKIIEDHGVMPDIKVSLDRDALLDGRDTQLEAAVNYIIKLTND
jgi:C-terminal processing protease CtpA/Prc